MGNKLELENIELIAKLAKTEKELNELRAFKASEGAKAAAAPSEEAKESMKELREQISELSKRLLLAKANVTQLIQQDYDKQVAALKEKVASNFEERKEGDLIREIIKERKEEGRRLDIKQCAAGKKEREREERKEEEFDSPAIKVGGFDWPTLQYVSKKRDQSEMGAFGAEMMLR